MDFFDKLLGFLAVLDFDFIVQSTFWILVEHLSGLHEALSKSSAPQKPGVVAHSCDPSIWEEG